MGRVTKYKDFSDTLLVRAFGHSPKLRIFDIFLTNPYFDFSKSELARELGMSKQTLYSNFKDLEELGIVEFSRRVGRAVLYKLNRRHPLVKRMDEMVTEMSMKIAEKEAEKTRKVVAIKAK